MDVPGLEEDWTQALRELNGQAGIALRALDGPVAAVGAETRHYAASTIKLAALGALLSGVENGTVRPGQTAAVRDRLPSAVGGRFRASQVDDQDDETWQRLGERADLMWLAERMIVESGNLAAGLVLAELGVGAVQAFLDRAGITGVTVNRLIGDHAAEDADVTNTVTAAGLAALMAGIADGSLLCEQSTATALDLLSRQAHRRMIPAGLPSGTWCASKGGWVPGVKHDVALVRPDAAPAYVLAVCTTSDFSDADGEAFVARLSAITWEHWSRWHA